LVLSLAAAAAALAGDATWRAFSAEMARARSRVATGSTVFEGRFGPMEYASAGDRPPCLMIHGTGGGFDQGLSFAAPLVDAGWTVIAPSRFGYLRSAFPEDPSSENQADAFVDLMDELGIARAPVLGGSAGAVSAMQFAIRHPDRCSALVAARKGQKTPDGYYNMERMLKRVVIAEGNVLLCGICMDARGMTDDDVMDGARRSTMDELAAETVSAEKVLVF
jgi:pimeloyl-ACP methyl ester carboxylesterase